MAEHYKILAAAYVLLCKDGKVAFMRRANTGFMDGKWGVPAGHLEANESLTQAAVREAREETGVGLDEGDLEFLHVSHRHYSDREGGKLSDYVDFFFTATRWEGEPKIMEPDKCDGLEWFDPEALPDDVVPNVKHAIEEAWDGVSFTQIGW